MPVSEGRVPFPDPGPDPRKIVEATLKSGIIDTKLSIGELVQKIGGDLDQVAGYVLAWEKYVLVVGAKADVMPEIRFR